MGKIEHFRVDFAGNKRTFYPGEILQGSIVLKTKKELKLRGIRVLFRGESRVRWTESHTTGSGSNRRTSHRTYSNHEDHINVMATIYGKDPNQSGDNPVLAAGDYTFPFNFQIPSTSLPTSYEGRHGHIRYWLKVIIDRPWRFDITTKVAFTIIQFVDINVPHLLNPVQMEENRSVGWLCCAAGNLTVTAQTDRGGYCPGEAICVSAYINNQMKREVIAVELILDQRTVFISSQGKSRTVNTEVAKVTREGVPRFTDAHLQMVPVAVPSLPPSMTGNRCIHIIYTLRVKVRIPWSTNSVLAFPITIGSIPYRPPVPQFQYVAPSAPPALPTDGYQAASPSAPPPYAPVSSYPEMPPPSYAECILGGGSIRDEEDNPDGMMGDTNFTPMYPVVPNYQYPASSAPPPQGAYATKFDAQ